MKRAQCKAARVLLGWTQHDLAREIDCSVSTVADYERGARDTLPFILKEIKAAFKRHGVRIGMTSIQHRPINEK